MDEYIVGLVEYILHVLLDDAGLPHRLVPQQYDLQLGLAAHRAHRVIHLSF